MKEKLRLLPIQIVERDEGIVLRRGVEQILIPDGNALLVMRVIQKALLKAARTETELVGLFAGPARPVISSLLEVLRAKRFIVALDADDAAQGESSAGQECPTDVFYWHFNQTQARVAKILNEKRWAFVGVNLLNQQLLTAMLDEGLENYVIVDDPLLRNAPLYDDRFALTSAFWHGQRSHMLDEDSFIDSTPVKEGFLVAASEFGGGCLLERWNEYAVTNEIAFYPVLLQNMVGYSGPLVIPGESPCLACMRARQNSNAGGFEEKRFMERHACDGQEVAAYHRSMLRVLATLAQFDLVKFKANIQWELGTLCEVNLLSGNIDRRRLLKAPRCPVCSGLRRRPLTNIHKQLTSPEAWSEIRKTVGHDES